MGALDGVKILDFTTLLPGPYATLMLADMGAEVLTVSARERYDLVRQAQPNVPGTDISANQAWLGRNKKTMFINLKHAQGREIIKKLIMRYDIVIEQFRPGVMQKLGLDYTSLSALNPRLIYCSLTGYGQSGPLRDRAGHDINYLARSGNMAYSGRKDTGPVLSAMQVADIAGGSLHSVIGILAALNYRHSTGQGQYIDISMLDSILPFNALNAAIFLASGVEPQREGRLLNGGSLYDFYETSDNQYLSVGSLEPQFWESFCRAIDRPQYMQGTVRPENTAQVKADIKEVIASKTLAQWLDIFNAVDACVEPVLNLNQALLQDRQVKARRMLVEVELPGGVKSRQLGLPIKLSKCAPRYEHGGFPLGYHTREVLEALGYAEDEIAAMAQHEVF